MSDTVEIVQALLKKTVCILDTRRIGRHFPGEKQPGVFRGQQSATANCNIEIKQVLNGREPTSGWTTFHDVHVKIVMRPVMAVFRGISDRQVGSIVIHFICIRVLHAGRCINVLSDVIKVGLPGYVFDDRPQQYIACIAVLIALSRLKCQGIVNEQRKEVPNLLEALFGGSGKALIPKTSHAGGVCQKSMDGDTLRNSRIGVVGDMLPNRILEIQLVILGKLADGDTCEHLVQGAQIELCVNPVWDVEALAGKSAGVTKYWSAVFSDQDTAGNSSWVSKSSKYP